MGLFTLSNAHVKHFETIQNESIRAILIARHKIAQLKAYMRVAADKKASTSQQDWKTVYVPPQERE